MAPTRQHSSTRPPNGIEQRIKAGLNQLVRDWLRLTWFRDWQRLLWTLPIAVWNWIIFGVLTYQWSGHWSDAWLSLSIITVSWLLLTLIRAGAVMPRRRAVVADIFQRVQQPAGHPRGTVTQPPVPSSYVRVVRWHRRQRPSRFVVAVNPTSPAGSSPLYRATVESALEGIDHAWKKNGGQWVFTWPSPAQVVVDVARSGDARIAQKNEHRFITSVLAQLFGITAIRRGQQPAAQELIVEQWGHQSHPTSGLSVPIPTRLLFVHNGASGSPSAAVWRDHVEREFDRQVVRGVTWLYDWTNPQVLVINSCDPASLHAQRKAEQRRISDLMQSLVPPRVKEPPAAAIVRWLPDSTGMPHLPQTVRVDFGTLNLGVTAERTKIENRLDDALNAVTRSVVVWTYDWTFGSSTTLVMQAYPAHHEKAQQRLVSKKLRQVVVDKFGDKVDLAVTEWVLRQSTDGRPVSRPRRVRVDFGSVDVTRVDTRASFESHWDSQAGDNDWAYRWRPADGYVETTAVPKIPDYIAFPAEGTAECAEWHKAFRVGRVIIGPRKGGGFAYIDLNATPHTLVGGNTGRGKSVLLTLLLYGALYNPDVVELVIVDPKVTDFTWTPGYPNVIAYAVKDARTAIEELHAVVKDAYEEMVRRQNLLSGYQVENLRELRRAASEGRIDLSLDEIPRRLIVFFDEMGAAFTPSKNKDHKALQDEARTWMEQIAMLGRAMEVNIFGAAQKPSNENIGTAMRNQMGNRIGIGWLESATSIQVLGNDLCHRLDKDNTPKGCGWVCAEGLEPALAQCLFIPKRTSPDLLDPSLMLEGVQERVARRLTSLGYQSVQVPHTFLRPDPDGQLVSVTIMVQEWVNPDRID